MPETSNAPDRMSRVTPGVAPGSPPTRRRMPLWRAGLALAALVVLAAVAAIAIPPSTGGLRSSFAPAASYDEALARARAIQASDGERILPEARSTLLAHGRRTTRAYVLLHGLTNCPQQFRALGERLHAAGANVWIPRLPHHGLADRMTTDLAALTAEELAEFGDRQVDIARGLGDSVTVCGLSLGGAMALWIAQTRPDVERSVAIAPLVGLALLPGPLTDGIRNVWLRAPNGFLWWDPRKRELLAGPRYAYPRYSTRAVAEILRLSYATRRLAERAPPAARSVAIVVNASDLAVEGAAAEKLARAWRRAGARNVRLLEFTKRLALGHDLVDPGQPYERVAFVHPLLERILGDARGAIAGADTLAVR